MTSYVAPSGSTNRSALKSAYGSVYGAPTHQYPGARFTLSLYQKISALPLDEFSALRDRALADESHSTATRALKRTFYSVGCALLPRSLLSVQAWMACTLHDFRYTVGPNVYKGTEEAAAADLREADIQLGRSLGLPDGHSLPEWMEALHRESGRSEPLAAHSWLYAPTPTCGPLFYNLRQLQHPVQHPL
ncbi:hypothetical protein ACWCPS_35835 [Streptomyces mauvecolor]